MLDLFRGDHHDADEEGEMMILVLSFLLDLPLLNDF
jgi:hypothetical protein